MKNISNKPVSIVIGAAFALTGLAAHASVFQGQDLGAGHAVAVAGEKKCGEGKCGEGKKGGSGDEGKTGGDPKKQ